MKKLLFLTFIALTISTMTTAQPWIQDDAIFNPSGIPSLPFSQPRLADLDGDGDFDLVIGSIDEGPKYFENTGTDTSPAFAPGPDIFSMVDPLDSEMGVFTDIDADGDLDLITGGYTGLHLFLNSGSPQNPEFEESAGFFNTVQSGSNPIPDFADLDNDGDPDMVVGFSESGLVRIYTNTGSPTSGQFDEASGYDVGDIGLYAYPVFCDADHDGDFDLIAGRDAHGFVTWENTGDATSATWENNDIYMEGLGAETYWNSLSLVDLTGDDEPDLVYGTASGPLHYFVQNGNMAAPDWAENTSLFGGVLDAGGASNPCFYDFDGDGDLDMISGSQLGDIKYYENTGTPTGPAWLENNSYFASIDHSIYSDVTIGDVDADGLPDAIVGDLSGNLYYHHNTGDGFEELTGYLDDISLDGWSSPCLYDLDDDGDLDIIAGADGGSLNYIENQGTPEMPDWIEISGFFGGINVGSGCVPAVSDVDFDGDPDVVCGTLFGDITCFLNEGGTWVENTDLFDGISVDQNAAPGFGDLDGDGDDDLAVGQYSGSFSYYRNQHFVTGINDPIVNPQKITASIQPNPVTDNFTIEFEMVESSMVDIRIFGVDGKMYASQKMRSAGPEKQQIGFNAAEWASGIYIVMISTGSGSTNLKLIRK